MLAVRKGTTKRCCYGVCKSDTRLKSFKTSNYYFINFPKPCLEYRKKNIKISRKLHIRACAKCAKSELWVKKCGRSDRGFRSIDNVTKDTYICSLHFLGESGPTEQNPDPLSYQEFQNIVKPISKMIKARTSLSEKYKKVHMEQENVSEYREIDGILTEAQPTHENVQSPSDESDPLIEVPEEEPPNSCEEDEELHVGLKCNVCSEEIRGFRYVCVQCSDWDMCGGCEARGEHAGHYVLRVPKPQPQQKVASMIEVLQKQLKTFLDVVENLPNREIKVEYDELELKPDPVDIDVHEESVVPQLTPLIVKQESSKQNKGAPSLTKWSVLPVLRGFWGHENAAEKPKLPIFIKNQSNKLTKTVMRFVPPGDNETGKQIQLDKSQPGTSANKRKTQQQACTSTKIPKTYLIYFKKVP